MESSLKNLNFKHKCLRCGAFFSKTDSRILQGCPNCGHHLFRLIREENICDKTTHAPQINNMNAGNTASQSETSEISTIKILENGIYEIDVDALLKNKNQPIIVSTSEGVYKIELGAELRLLKKSKTKK